MDGQVVHVLGVVLGVVPQEVINLGGCVSRGIHLRALCHQLAKLLMNQLMGDVKCENGLKTH